MITFLNHDHDVSNNNDSSIGGSNNNNSYEHEQMPTVETAVTHMQYNPRSIHSCFLDAASEGLTFDKMQPKRNCATTGCSVGEGRDDVQPWPGLQQHVGSPDVGHLLSVELGLLWPFLRISIVRLLQQNHGFPGFQNSLRRGHLFVTAPWTTGCGRSAGADGWWVKEEGLE